VHIIAPPAALPKGFMLSLSILALAAALGIIPLSLTANQRETGVVLRAVRFYRADQDRTRVKGLVQIPLSFLQAARPGGESSYTVAVRLADSTGLALYQQSWQSRARMIGADSGAYTVEIVDFAVAPGKYRFEVGVQDSASGRKISTATEFQALSDSSVASDLLIAPEIRLATADDTVPRPGEFRTGNNLVTASARVLLTPLRAKVFYLLEAYADQEGDGSLSVTVRDSAGRTSMDTPALPVKVTAGGSVLKGQLDLTGLPPGDYAMLANLQLRGRTIQRSAQFSMAGLTETLARDAARREAERVTDEGYFGGMSEPELKEAEAPLEYIAEARELSTWSDELSVEAKRRFLTAFWKQRDPTPGTPRNERRESFYAAIDYANKTFTESSRNPISGWRSDRGRIFAKNGAPDDVLRRQQEGRAPPYEVWSYAKGKGYYYIFADRSGFGAYTLIHSNDRQESGLPGWSDLLGGPAVSDAGRFLGVDLFAASRRS
jgi:GWxTD domain-containing protein